jgi:uncharacterized protein YgiM (DUF1202 family)
MHKKISSLAAIMLVITSSYTLAHETLIDSPQYSYITDNVYLPFHTNPNSLSKTITSLQSNIKVRVIKDMGKWTKIKFAKDEGYILSRYLINSSTTRARLGRLQDSYSSIHKENSKLKRIIKNTLIDQNKLLLGEFENFNFILKD